VDEPNAVLGANTPGDDMTRDAEHESFLAEAAAAEEVKANAVDNEPKPGAVVLSNPFGAVATTDDDETAILEAIHGADIESVI
jgi:hypothetical protein